MTPQICYFLPVDPREKQEKTKIKVKLPDGTNYQMVPFRAGINEDYVNHIIDMMGLLQQKGVKSDVEKAFGVVTDTRDKLGPLYKKLNMSKFNQEKEDLNKQIKTTEEDLLKAKRGALAEIVKAYELFCVYFVGKACTQWDKVVQEMRILGS